MYSEIAKCRKRRLLILQLFTETGRTIGKLLANVTVIFDRTRDGLDCLVLFFHLLIKSRKYI